MELFKGMAMLVDLKRYVTMPLAAPYYMAQVRDAWVSYLTLPLVISECFWKTWGDVYRPTGRKDAS